MKLVHVQSIMTEEQLEELKEKTGEKATKDAIQKAVDFYIEAHQGEGEQ